MSSEEAKQSAWVYYYSQAISDLTGIADEYEDAGIKVSQPTGPKTIVDLAVKIADEAVAMLMERKIPEEYWPTAPK